MLLQSARPVVQKPHITSTTHPLPFNALSPSDFERLCLWLIEREGYERVEHPGAAGSEQGRDIVAWREGRLWAFQCKRVQAFGPKDASAEIDKVLALPQDLRPTEFVFIVTCDVSAKTRQRARECCAGQMSCRFWAGTELDEKAKRHSDIVAEFFSPLNVAQGIESIQQRALTAAEEAAQARELETQLLAQGVGAFAQRLQALVGEPAESGGPYKGLLEYRLSDADIFFGRAHATSRLLQALKRDPLTILHSETGAGKTSLLQAGIAPRLLAGGDLPVYIRRVYNVNPALGIKRIFIPDLSQVPQLRDAPLRDFLHRVCQVLGVQATVFVFIDQFEEFFTWLDELEQKAFVNELAECLEDESLNVRWVLALRSEFFSKLADFRPRIDNPFRNDYRLNRLKHAEARDAILRPAELHDVRFEDAVVDALLNELGKEEIAPPQIQLVCSALHAELEPGQTTITWALYERLGRAEGILRGYLERVLNRHLPPTQRNAARRLLEALVTADGKRALRSQPELVADSAGWGVSPEILYTIIDQLVDSRLLRAHEGGTGSTDVTYELAHDYLLGEIELDPEVQARKAAQELLDQEVRSYRRHQTLMGAKRLAVIEEWRDRLRFTPEAQQLFTESQAAVQKELAARERSRRRRTRAAMWVTGFVLVLAALAGGGWWQSERQRQIAIARQLAAQAQTTLDNTGTGLVRSVLLATESLNHAPTLEGNQILRRGVSLLPSLVTSMTHDGPVSAMAFSPDGRWLASMSEDNSMQVREATTGKTAVTMTHKGPASAIACSPDGQWVASGSEDGTVRIWKVATRETVVTMTHERAVITIAFSPDGQRVASGSLDKTARVWETITGREVVTMPHEAPVRAVAFSPDGEWMASGSGKQDIVPSYDSGKIRVWETATWQETSSIQQERTVLAVAFSPDGQRVASGSTANMARVWETDTGRQMAQMEHKGPVEVVVVSFDGRWVASGSTDGTVRVWETVTGGEVARMEHRDDVLAVAFSPDGQQVASGSRDGTVKVWEIDTEEKTGRMKHESDVRAVAFSPDGRWIASGSGDWDSPVGEARVWETDTGDNIVTVTHEGPVRAVAFSPDGRSVASGGQDRRVKVWQTVTGKPVVTMTCEGPISAIAFSPDPDGRWVASGSNASTEWVRVWEAATGSPVMTTTHEGPANAVAFSHDGQRLLSWSGDNVVRIWEAANRKQVITMTYERVVRAVAGSPDGRWIALGSADSTVRVWEAITQREVSQIRHDDKISAVAFSPDGRWVASGSEDGEVRVWEATTGREAARMEHGNEVLAVAFSPDGRVASGSRDDMVRVWLWKPEDLTREACGRLPRNLTRQEWRLYWGDKDYRPTCPELPVPEE